nr:MAG TPA: hypothetical protein [Caudoviricetes sp.]
MFCFSPMEKFKPHTLKKTSCRNIGRFVVL